MGPVAYLQVWAGLSEGGSVLVTPEGRTGIPGRKRQEAGLNKKYLVWIAVQRQNVVSRAPVTGGHQQRHLLWVIDPAPEGVPSCSLLHLRV